MKYDIDYSTIRSTNHRLYLSEKPCNQKMLYKKYGKSAYSHWFKDANDKEGGECIDDFLDFLTDEKIGTVVVLLTEAQMDKYYDEKLIHAYEKEGIRVIHYPIRDFSTPKDFSSFHRLMKQINHRLKNENVLIHCSAGWGRTGTVAAGLAVYKGHNWQDAIRLIRRVRPGSIETEMQERYIRSYASYRDLQEDLSHIFKF